MTTEQSSAAATGLGPTEAPPRPDIFLAADDMRLATLVSAELAATGFTIRRAENAEAAVEAITRSRPSALIVDLALPRPHDGYWTIESIRSNPALRYLPVIALVERAARASARAALARGADEFVYKPLDVQELAVRLEALVRRRGTANHGRHARLELRLFGPLRLDVDGQSVIDEQFTRRKVKALLAYLYLNRGRFVPKYRLLDELWPGADDAGRLKQSISILRATIEPSGSARGLWRYVRERAGRYYFDRTADYWSDVEAFEQELALARAAAQRGEFDDALDHYDRALAYRTGDFLVEFREEDWAAPEAARVQELYLEALEEVARLHVARREYGAAVERLRESVLADPLREASYLDLMRTLWLGGQRTEALRVYQRLVEVLARAFQVPPQPEATQLYDAIRLGEERTVTGRDAATGAGR
jgi:DNA-binding SARP family transcriptional activator/ActR/RegA family two-component response regulator